MQSLSVPLVDLAAQHRPIRAELLAAIEQVIDSGNFAGGPVVAEFEAEFAAFCQVRHAVGVGSGTDALWLALVALGIGAGDEVITVSATFMATAEAISWCGARPVFVDIDETTFTMDPAQIERAITRRTKAIIPVHLYGQMADMDPILEIARRHGLSVVEDACQAHGAEYKGRCAGSMGDAGCFSFYPGKNLGALGEAGAVTTNDRAVAERLKVLRDHGQVAKYCHTAVGWNGRMDGIQAAALRIKLRGLAAGNAARRRHAQRYAELLGDCEAVSIPVTGEDRLPVHHVYAVRVPARDQVRTTLQGRGIGCGTHYPTPVHLQPAYAHLGYRRGALPVTERCADEVLSLPMFPELQPDQIEIVARELRAAVAPSAQPELSTSHGGVATTR